VGKLASHQQELEDEFGGRKKESGETVSPFKWAQSKRRSLATVGGGKRKGARTIVGHSLFRQKAAKGKWGDCGKRRGNHLVPTGG